MRVHFIGIGGTGLSAIARLLLEKGYEVSGSDRVLSPLTLSLQQAGAAIYQGHQPENIQSPDIVVRSSAVRDDNPEVIAAKNAGIPVVKRAEFLGQFMQNYTGIAVAGTHGKTTTTAMIAWMLSAIGKDPSYIIGGVSKNLGTNAHSGLDAGYFVIEADEYDRMFLGLLPKLIIVTNTQHDHPDCFPTAQIYQEAFQEFTGTLEPGGILLACGEDSGSTSLADFVAGQKRGVQVYRYGSEPDGNNATNDYYARNIRINNHGGFDYEAWYTHQSAGLAEVSLKIPGKHNLLNSLAALAATHQLHLPMDAAAQALSRFSGTERRFDLRGEPCGIAIIDDYAHHPAEIQATLQSARLRYPDRRIWAVWQPHTFSRVQALYDEFLTAFAEADCVIVTDVYASRENNVVFPIANLVENMNHSHTCFIPSLTGVTSYLLEKVRAGDVVLVLSAGDANLISTDLLHELSLF